MTAAIKLLLLLTLAALLAATPGFGRAPAPVPGKQRLKPDEIQAVVRAWFRAEKPAARLPETLPLDELTTDDIWQKLGVQVVKVASRESPLDAQTFVLQGGRVVPIGASFGGAGVTSLVLADLLHDGKPKLVFAYAWGSGLHRSQVGVYDPHGKEPLRLVADQAYFNDPAHDLVVRAVDAQTVRVLAGEVPFGVLVLEEQEGRLRARINLDRQFPPRMRANVRELPP
jgi:hypothetical protein